jgi:teichuronic acid biosynthesis glycosyltransferase TuaG
MTNDNTGSVVSVIIPSFRMGHLICDALESVGTQTYPHWEVIVVDDAGPEDGTRTAVEAFAAKHPRNRIEYIRHEKNAGVSAARRTAFRQTQGEYVAFLDADDSFLPQKLKRQVAALEMHTDAVLCHGPVISEGLEKECGPSATDWFRLAKQGFTYDETHRENFLKADHIANSSVMCRAAALRESDFPARMTHQFEDWLLWLQLAERGTFRYEPEPLTNYRFHEGGYTWRAWQTPGAEQWARIELLTLYAARAKRVRNRTRAGLELARCLMSVAAGGADSGTRNGSSWRLPCALATGFVLAGLLRGASAIRRFVHRAGRPTAVTKQ